MLSKKLVNLLATGFYTGYTPVMPGTAGTIACIPVFFITSLFFPLYYYLVFTVLFVLFSIWISGKAEAQSDKKDPSEIVIDEMAGFLVAMATFPPQLLYIATGFILFRLFDIFKPFPAGRINKKMTGGKGVVLDDVVAGVYANVVMQIGSKLISL